MPLYIELFHGRRLGQELQDWGEPGPIFELGEYCHTTYAQEIKFGDDGDFILSVAPDTADGTVSDCVYYGGMYYGDWSVFSRAKLPSELKARLEPFDKIKAALPRAA